MRINQKGSMSIILMLLIIASGFTIFIAISRTADNELSKSQIDNAIKSSVGRYATNLFNYLRVDGVSLPPIHDLNDEKIKELGSLPLIPLSNEQYTISEDEPTEHTIQITVNRACNSYTEKLVDGYDGVISIRAKISDGFYCIDSN